MSAIHTLFTNQDLQIYLLSTESMAFLLSPGLTHSITIETESQGPTCGLLPIGSDTVVMETIGLKWNLNPAMPLRFGGLVSSSNAFDVNPGSESRRHTVTASTDKPVVFTVQIDLSQL